MNANGIIAKYNLDKSTWTKKALHAVLHFYFPVGPEAIKPLKEYFGDCYSVVPYFIKNDYMHWYWNTQDMTRLRKEFLKRVNKDPSYLDQLLTEWHKRVDLFNKIMNKIDSTNLSKLSDNELMDLYYEWFNAYIAEYGLAIGLQDAFSMKAEDFLVPHFQKVIPKNKFNKYYLALLSPTKESFIKREYRDRLLLMQGQGSLKEHTKKYYWLHNNYAKDIILDEEYFKKEMAGLSSEKELSQLDKELKDIKKKKEAAIKELNLNQESLNLIRITDTFAYMQDERKKYVLISTNYQNRFLKECAKRIGVKKEEIEYTIIHELKNLLETKKVDHNLMKERKKICFVVNSEEGHEIFSGDVAQEIFETVFEKENKEVDELKGSIACKGKATGIVKIIEKTHDIISMDDGDILISSMTRPDMVIAMKKAAAIVTNEGGITSHAAVISRELNIPCVIGTKIATKIFQNGDLVEVDANKGIVRKLE